MGYEYLAPLYCKGRIGGSGELASTLRSDKLSLAL